MVRIVGKLRGLRLGDILSAEVGDVCWFSGRVVGSGDNLECIRFGNKCILEDHFTDFQTAIIDAREIIFQIVEWVVGGNKIEDFRLDISYFQRTHSDMCSYKCDWTGKSYWTGLGTAHEWLGYLRFGNRSIYDIGDTMSEYYAALYDWADQAVGWIQDYVNDLFMEAESISKSVNNCDESLYHIWVSKKGGAVGIYLPVTAASDKIAFEESYYEPDHETGGAFWAGAGPISEEAEKELALGIEEARQKRIREDELALSQATPEPVPLAGVVSRDGQSLVEEEVEFTTTSGDPESSIGFHDALEKKSSQPT